MKTTFIYVLKDPETGGIRYVGKTNYPSRRLREHCWKSRNHFSYLGNWLRSLAVLPIFEVIDETSQEHGAALEAAYILFFRVSGCRLVNGTEGGEGGPGHPGKKMSEDTRAKMSASKLGEKNANFGVKFSVERRAKMSRARIGSTRSVESVEKGRRKILGIRRSEDTIARIRASKQGNKNPNFGKSIPHSVETRAKMSEQKRLWWANRKEQKICETE